MKPFMKYPGGKTKEVPLINKYKPKKINRYFEPFVGGGSVYFELAIKESFINDFSTDLIDIYKCLQEQSDELKSILKDFDLLWKNIAILKNNYLLKKYFKVDQFEKYYKKSLVRKNIMIQKLLESGKNVSEENLKLLDDTAKKTSLYMLVRDLYNNKEIKDYRHLASFYFLREYCYSSMFRFSKNGDFNVPYGGISYNDKMMTTKLNAMFSSEMKNYLKNTQIFNLDFENFLNRFEFNADDFIFLDPPYDSDFSTYDQNSFDKNEQIRLKECLSKISAKWMLIIKKTEFIYSLYSNFNIYEYDMNYMVSFKNRNSRKVQHLLITNYELGDEYK